MTGSAKRKRVREFVEGCPDCEKERVRETFEADVMDCDGLPNLDVLLADAKFGPGDKVRVTVELISRQPGAGKGAKG